PDSTIVWKEDGGIRFVTSDALTADASSAVEAFLKAHPITQDQFQLWDRFKPASEYKFTDEAPGEPANRQTFPRERLPVGRLAWCFVRELVLRRRLEAVPQLELVLGNRVRLQKSLDRTRGIRREGIGGDEANAAVLLPHDGRIG